MMGGWNLPQSKWANPFKVKNMSERAQRVEEYRTFVQSKPELMKSLHELKGKRFVIFTNQNLNILLDDEHFQYQTQACNVQTAAVLLSDWDVGASH